MHSPAATALRTAKTTSRTKMYIMGILVENIVP
jgi:hypothetical protein